MNTKTEFETKASSSLVASASVERQSVSSFTEKAYLNYSMYVILDRALPHIGDGLKPVQRRIVYAMSELGLKASAKFKKSARTVGDVLGKYHPHGDAACYEAMVLMAQPFSYRYPLVDGQGNWGSADDPKSFAAMRYTESRMSAYTEILLQELEQGTVDWIPNFDGTLEEPSVLPARLPNVLLNGAMGIAVGMSTDVPPHNLREVADACVYLLDNDRATLEDICCYVKAPDFPTEAEIITPAAEILEIYRKGNGGLRARAVYVSEEGEIVITALPYQVSGAKVLEQIAAQMQAKKLPLVADLRDESDHENPTRVVIVPRSNRVDVEALMAHLFATTDLERSYRINLNVIGIDGRPQVKDLLSLLKEWLEFRKVTVRRRLQYRLDKILERLHILQGLMIAYLNLDQVIHIIRTEDKPKEALMAQFKLSEIQTNAILDLKLRHLAKLEEIKIRSEQEELQRESDEIASILGSEVRLKALLRKELLADAAKYGDERRSALVVRGEAKAMREEEILPTELVTVVLSQQGWVRVAKGHDVNPEELAYKAGDAFKMKACGRSNQMAVLLDSTGRSYSIPVHKLPSARGHGEPLTSHFEIPVAATFEAVLLDKPEQNYLFASDLGYGFIAKLEDLYAKNKAGKTFLTLPEGAKVLTPCPVINLEEQYLIAVTNVGNMLIFPVASLPVLPRGKGNKIINIPRELFKTRQEYLSNLAMMHESDNLILWAGVRDLALRGNNLAGYHGERGRRGNKLPRAFRKLDRVEIVSVRPPPSSSL